MITKFIEASQGGRGNWGKFLVGRFDAEEWSRTSHVAEHDVEKPLSLKLSLLSARGWSPEHVIVFDLETCEGAAFAPHGLARADLEKHKIWVCPLFEPFLIWLYQQDLSDITQLPSYVCLPEAEFQQFGHRRPGPKNC